MKINFYEEFPTDENLKKIKLIDFPTRLIVGAKSIKEFHLVREKIKKCKNKRIMEVIYWPIIEKHEGYWLSAFSKNNALKRIINELKQNKKLLTIMWDAELPFYRSKVLLFIPNYLYYFKNRKTILDFFRNAKRFNIKILTSEYPLESPIIRHILFHLFLISFNPKIFRNKKIVMIYSSILRNHLNVGKFLKRQVKAGKKYFGEDFMVALGVIAEGIHDNEPKLNLAEFERDLKTVKEMGISEVYIYRLSGLNKYHVNIIKKFL